MAWIDSKPFEEAFIEKERKRLDGLTFLTELHLRWAFSEAARLFYPMGFAHGVEEQETRVQEALGLLREPEYS